MVSLPAKEFQRKYMRQLVLSIMKVSNANKQEAKMIATGMVLFFKEHTQEGRDIDLGFLKIEAKQTKPRELKNNLNGQRYFRGESIRWKLLFRDKWLKEACPAWNFRSVR